ncbi:MAG: hypothetical protein CBC65_000865 [Rhodothermaceae bacterium TMED105]|jgi:hypothetical protein|nr:MAG: hypothetical protein CBC65_000865 [Rhodothermaceae bacterium TMED105]|tara:strand:+ start:774 stop:1175 length:402 start_codon:yes stop_codon:yes gene_type:complete
MSGFFSGAFSSSRALFPVVGRLFITSYVEKGSVDEPAVGGKENVAVDEPTSAVDEPAVGGKENVDRPTSDGSVDGPGIGGLVSIGFVDSSSFAARYLNDFFVLRERRLFRNLLLRVRRDFIFVLFFDMFDYIR